MTDTQAVHAPLNTETEPCGDLSIRTLAMPADTNQNGGNFTYVSIDDQGHPQVIARDGAPISA